MAGREQNLWAPWRIGYLEGLADDTADQPEDRTCFLCEAVRDGLSESQLSDRLVLVSDQRGVLMLNRYPYINGHLLAAPRRHVGDLADLTPTQRADLMELAVLGQQALRQVMNPQGFNIGMNLGRCAGAGVPGHAHLHVVPRWHGDVNFMRVVGEVRVIPQALATSYSALKKAVERIAPAGS